MGPSDNSEQIYSERCKKNTAIYKKQSETRIELLQRFESYKNMPVYIQADEASQPSIAISSQNAESIIIKRRAVLLSNSLISEIFSQESAFNKKMITYTTMTPTVKKKSI